MTREQFWQIFKNTGSIEAYISYATSSATSEKENVGNDKDKWDNPENKGYTG